MLCQLTSFACASVYAHVCMLVNVRACKKKDDDLVRTLVYKDFEELMLTKPRVFFKSFLAT